MRFFKITTILTSIVLFFMTAIILNSCRHTGKRYYKTYTGKYVTIWDNYIIFEKYKGDEPPKDNYIRVIGQYKGWVTIFFKSNDSIYIWRNFDENSMEIGLNDNVFLVDVYYGNESYKEFKKRASFQDPLVYAKYNFYSFPEDGNILFPILSECIGDSVFTKSYKVNTLFHTDEVFSRYDEELK